MVKVYNMAIRDGDEKTRPFDACEVGTHPASTALVLKSDFDKLVEALKYVCRVTYGTEISNSQAENNEILARHFFNSQEKCRTVLAEMGIEQWKI